MRSIRSCSRARTGERGFALIWAVGLALLFFLLVQLVLIDSARELAEARRFRAKIVASVLAENGAELAAVQIVDRVIGSARAEDWQGSIHGTMNKNYAGEFVIVAEGETAGVTPAKATVRVQGRVTGKNIHIDYTMHSQ